jgi:hypothetical protein
MKTIKVIKSLIVVMTICFAFSASAITDPTNILSKESKMDRIVTRSVGFPNVLKDDNCDKTIVSVDFKVAENGHIVVKEINGNPTFASYVKEKLESVVLKKMSELNGKSFIYRFVFSK